MSCFPVLVCHVRSVGRVISFEESEWAVNGVGPTPALRRLFGSDYRFFLDRDLKRSIISFLNQPSLIQCRQQRTKRVIINWNMLKPQL